MVADAGECACGAEFGFEFQFLVRDVGLGDADVAEVALDRFGVVVDGASWSLRRRTFHETRRIQHCSLGRRRELRSGSRQWRYRK